MKSSTLFSLASVLFLAGCAGTEHVYIDETNKGPATSTLPAESTADAASFCGSLCGRQESCDTSLDVQTCKNSCTNGFAAVFPKLRQDVVGLIVECFGAKDCKTVLEGSVVATCAEEAVASVAPSSQATAFCDELSAAKKKCGSTSTTKAACLDQAKLYSDTAIAEAANCADRPCTEMDRCVAATFGELGGTGTNTTPKPSTNQCSGQFSDLGSCQSCAEGACCSEAAACAGDSYCRAYMAECQDSGGRSYSECTQLLQGSLPSTSRQLLGAYYTCASSSCSSSCGFTQN
jgi:hypothetical protein